MVLTTHHATRLSRRVLWALIVLYILPGLLGRSPWKPDDAVGFGQAFTLMHSPWSDWAIGAIGDRPYAEGGLLHAWSAALFGQLGLFFNAPQPWLDDITRLSNVFWFVVLGWAIWNSTYRLAQRIELQPVNPLGTPPSPTNYARALADCSLLCLLATLGLLLKSHFSIPELPALAGIALLILASVSALTRPIGSGWLLGLACAIVLFARGFSFLWCVLLCLLIGAVMHPALRFGLLHRLFRASIVLLLCILPWWLWANSHPNGPQWLNQWTTWNLERFWALTETNLPATISNIPSIMYLCLTWSGKAIQTSFWFLWPALPMALWCLWHHRMQLKTPAFRIPIAALMGAVLHLALSNPFEEANYLLFIPPMCILAALGIASMRRGLIGLIDWFAVFCFTLIAALVWLGFTATTLGWPDKIALRFERLSPGFSIDPTTTTLGFAVAMAATIAWLLLLRWRWCSQQFTLWRPMVLSCAGVILIWLLLMTLWLPRINHAKSFSEVSQQLAWFVSQHQQQHLSAHEADFINPKAPRLNIDNNANAQLDSSILTTPCIFDVNLGWAQRAALQYHSRLSFIDVKNNHSNRTCPYALQQIDLRNVHVASDVDKKTLPFAMLNPNENWQEVWRGARRADRHELFILHQTTKQAPQ